MNALQRAWVRFDLVRLAALGIAGHWVWLLIFLPLLWLGARALASLINPTGSFEPVDAQVGLMGIPLAVLAIILGLRIIAGEMDGRSLEIAYTVPGGCIRLWWAKLAAAALILLAALVLLALGALVFTEYPPVAVWGALQGGVFYLALSMALATLFRSEVAGAMLTVAVLAFDLLILGNLVIRRVSPFWNPLAEANPDPDAILAMMVQNRIGIPLVTLLIVALAFMRANRRERMLGG